MKYADRPVTYGFFSRIVLPRLPGYRLSRRKCGFKCSLTARGTHCGIKAGEKGGASKVQAVPSGKILWRKYVLMGFLVSFNFEDIFQWVIELSVLHHCYMYIQTSMVCSRRLTDVMILTCGVMIKQDARYNIRVSQFLTLFISFHILLSGKIIYVQWELSFSGHMLKC